MAPFRNSPSLDRRLLAYSAAAGVVLAVAPDADAQIVYTDVDPDAVVSGGSVSYDIDGDGTDDFAFVQATISSGERPLILAYGSNIANRFAGYAGPYFNYGNALDEGTTIDANLTFLATTQTANGAARDDARAFLASTYPGYGAYGPFADDGVTDKYLGVRFVAGAGTTHYAWFLLSSGASSSSLTVQGYAYETMPNTAIVAGDQGGITATDPDALAEGYRFTPLAPNPVTGRSRFEVGVGQTEMVKVEVFDALGRSQVVLHDGLIAGGAAQPFALESGTLPSGVYVVRVTGESFDSSRTVTVLR